MNYGTPPRLRWHLSDAVIIRQLGKCAAYGAIVHEYEILVHISSSVLTARHQKL